VGIMAGTHHSSHVYILLHPPRLFVVVVFHSFFFCVQHNCLYSCGVSSLNFPHPPQFTRIRSSSASTTTVCTVVVFHSSFFCILSSSVSSHNFPRLTRPFATLRWFPVYTSTSTTIRSTRLATQRTFPKKYLVWRIGIQGSISTGLLIIPRTP
jgi:hypothetical protein